MNVLYGRKSTLGNGKQHEAKHYGLSQTREKRDQNGDWPGVKTIEMRRRKSSHSVKGLWHSGGAGSQVQN